MFVIEYYDLFNVECFLWFCISTMLFSHTRLFVSNFVYCILHDREHNADFILHRFNLHFSSFYPIVQDIFYHRIGYIITFL